MTYYVVGSPRDVRGQCPHRHRTFDGAIRCHARDHAACKALGGGAYSDRRVIYGSDGSTWSLEYRDRYGKWYDEPTWENTAEWEGEA